MIDSIKVYKEISLTSYEVERLRNIMHSCTLKLKYNNETEVQGYYKNMHIKISESRIVVTGSINVLAKGDNVKLVRINELYDAIVSLSDFIRIDLLDSIVTRLDISINVLSDLSVDLIKQTLSLPKYLKKISFEKDGVSYKNSNRMICFYNKLKQANLKKTNIPSSFSSMQFVRVEYRLLKASVVDSVFGLSRTKLIEVLENYEVLTQYFKNELANLEWPNSHNNNHEYFDSDVDLKLFLMLKGLVAIGGIDEGYNIVECKRKTTKNVYRNKFINEKRLLEKLNKIVITDGVKNSISMFNKLVELAFDYEQKFRGNIIFK